VAIAWGDDKQQVMQTRPASYERTTDAGTILATRELYNTAGKCWRVCGAQFRDREMQCETSIAPRPELNLSIQCLRQQFQSADPGSSTDICLRKY
jgi:hypothetical protein